MPTRRFRLVSRTLCNPLLAVLFLLVTAGAGVAAPAGSVVGLAGACFVESGGARTPARLSQEVQVGDTVDVPQGGRLKLRMADGSIVSVASGSRLTIAAYSVDAAGQRQQARLSLAEGLLRSVVAPAQQPASFEVDTAVGAAAVRSTDWFVRTGQGAMQVGVLTGSVDMISAATRRGVTIPARWGARLEAGRDPVPPRLWSQGEFDDVIARTTVP